MRIRKKIFVTSGISILILLAVFFVCLFFGTAHIGIQKFFSILMKHAGFETGHQFTKADDVILIDIRMPRIIIACLAGGGLAIVGGVMQGLFKNSLAEPGVLGWSSGGALFAVIAIYTGLSKFNFLILPASAFLGTLTAALFVYVIAYENGYTRSYTLLLAGVAIGSLFVSLTTFVLSIANVWSMREMLFWIMGGFDASSWTHVKLVFLPIIISSCGIVFFSRDLNAILLGDESAKTLGVNIDRTRIWLIVLSSVVVGSCVSVSGVIGFVGLIVPHMLRLIVGVDNRVLLPASFFTGAGFMALTDLVARTILSPQELRINVITSCIGVPFFLYLLRKNRSKYGSI